MDDDGNEHGEGDRVPKERALAALVAIATNTKEDINLCLFVDALDEHGGNHQELLATLTQITKLGSNPHFRIRLCVASRPENIFRVHFTDYPGIEIHHHTGEDIRAYAHGRLQVEINARNDVPDRQGLRGLVTGIIENAQGVFMWVRLVVEELVVAVWEGDSVQELKMLLSTIPTELEDLYVRVVRRNLLRPRMRKIVAEHKLET
jgi:hypothetical protein